MYVHKFLSCLRVYPRYWRQSPDPVCTPAIVGMIFWLHTLYPQSGDHDLDILVAPPQTCVLGIGDTAAKFCMHNAKREWVWRTLCILTMVLWPWPWISCAQGIEARCSQVWYVEFLFDGWSAFCVYLGHWAWTCCLHLEVLVASPLLSVWVSSGEYPNELTSVIMGLERWNLTWKGWWT